MPIHIIMYAKNHISNPSPFCTLYILLTPSPYIHTNEFLYLFLKFD